MMVMFFAMVDSDKKFSFSKVMVVLRSVMLTLGAIVGVVCIILTVGALLFGFRPVVVISGSMEPEIMTGSMVVGQRIAANKINVGDVVTVPRPTGGLITHRVVSTENVGQQASLVLKGDANQIADVQPYKVDNVYKVVGSVAHVGTFVEVLRSPQGLGLLGLFWLLLVVVYFWKPQPSST